MLLIAIGVVIAISLLVLGGAVGRGRHVDIASVPVERGGNGLRWIWIGVGVSSIPLVVALVWTVSVLAAVSAPTGKPAVVIEVTGAQWWWKARYMDRDPARIFTTANEIHIPTGEPVQIRLTSADVIHSFWVPALGGKTDTIPGQTNVTWLQADMAGTYRGQCTEFCGWQHAHMGFLVLAQPTGTIPTLGGRPNQAGAAPDLSPGSSREGRVRVPLWRMSHGPRQQGRGKRGA